MLILDNFGFIKDKIGRAFKGENKPLGGITEAFSVKPFS